MYHGENLIKKRKGFTDTLEDLVNAYQEALRHHNTAEEKKYFTLIYAACLNLLWSIAWRAFRKCRYPRLKRDCLDRDGRGRWSWNDFSYPLIHGLAIAAARFKLEHGAAFTSFAYSCVRRTLENHCRRRCRGRTEQLEIELEESPDKRASAPLDTIVRREETEAILGAMKKAYTPESPEYLMIACFLLNFTQKDIVFMLSRSDPGGNFTEPLVSQYLNRRIPERLKTVSAELADFFYESELENLSLKDLRAEASLRARFIGESGETVGRIRKLLAGLVLEIKAGANNGRPIGAAAREKLRAFLDGTEREVGADPEFQAAFDRFFEALTRDGKKLKEFMKGLKEAMQAYGKKGETA